MCVGIPDFRVTRNDCDAKKRQRPEVVRRAQTQMRRANLFFRNQLKLRLRASTPDKLR